MKKGILIFLGLAAVAAGTVLLVKKFKKPTAAPSTPTNFSDENLTEEFENVIDEYENATGRRMKKVADRVAGNKYVKKAIETGEEVVKRTPARHVAGFAKKRFGR